MIEPIEGAANAVMTLSIFLAARNSVHTWWTGIVGCLLFAVTFYRAALYADVTLQVFFIVTSAIGWWQWLRGNGGDVLTVSRAEPATWPPRLLLPWLQRRRTARCWCVSRTPIC